MSAAVLRMCSALATGSAGICQHRLPVALAGDGRSCHSCGLPWGSSWFAVSAEAPYGDAAAEKPKAFAAGRSYKQGKTMT